MPSPSDSESTGSCLGAARPWGLGRETQAEQQAPVSSPCAERVKAKRREKGPETLLVKEGGCRPGRDSGTAPGRDAPWGHCPAPSRPPALLATHRPRTGHARPSRPGGLACLSPLLPRASVCCCRPAELSRRLPHFSSPISRARRLCLPPTSVLPEGAGDASAAVSADRTLQKGRADGGRMKGPEAGVRG